MIGLNRPTPQFGSMYIIVTMFNLLKYFKWIFHSTGRKSYSDLSLNINVYGTDQSCDKMNLMNLMKNEKQKSVSLLPVTLQI